MSLKNQLIAIVLMVCAPCAALAGDVPLGGFIPFVGIGLTDEFIDASTDLAGTFFLAQPEFSQVGAPLTGSSGPYHDIALLDTGAATHILTLEAAGSAGFDINGNGFDGTNVQQIGGATGLINLSINDPLAIFAAGLGDRTAAGASLAINTAAFRGQSSVATLSAPAEWTLPNIIGLPMAAQHAIAIRNSDPQIFDLAGRTVRTPQVDFIDLGTGDQQGILRRTDLKLRSGTAFIAGPLYIQNLDLLGGFDFHENPLSPTIVENGAMFVDVDLQRAGNVLADKELLLDTGADMTVVSQLTAKRLGFDALLDMPDFVLEVEGSGGVSSGVPGFFLDELNIDTVGGSFTKQNVPIAVLDVTNPNDPGNIIDGILGMHLFTGRDIVIDANPSIGQGGAGPSLYISDPVTQDHSWATTAASADFATAGSWASPGVPSKMWVAQVGNVSGSGQTATVSADASVFQITVSGTPTAAMIVDIQSGTTLTTFGETRIDQGGEVRLSGGKLDTQFVNIEGGALTGAGEVFAGTGPITGVVRNLSGRVEPAGTLTITGDFSNLDAGTLAIDLNPGSNDLLAVDRFAFLAGVLEVSLQGGLSPTIGQMFTILTAGEGIVGEFDFVQLPDGFFWNVDTQANNLVLEVTGIGTLAGDFDKNGTVDAADLAMWQTGYGQQWGLTGDDFLTWQQNLGATAVTSTATSVPEPATAWLACCVAIVPFLRRIRSH